jgi:threonine/homoserine/homoserine lactone efflux protein
VAAEDLAELAMLVFSLTMSISPGPVNMVIVAVSSSVTPSCVSESLRVFR